MSLKSIPHKKKKTVKRKRTPTQHDKGKGGWPDYDERENVFFTPKQTTYSKVLTIRSPEAASAAIDWMEDEYKLASGKKRGKGVQPSKEWRDQVLKAMDNTAKRAELSTKRNLSPKEDKEMTIVARRYKEALASDKFGNYYDAKRMGAAYYPSGVSKQQILGKGTAGKSGMRFRIATQTKKGKTVMMFKPFRLVFTTGSKQKAVAKKKEMARAGYAVRVIRDGNKRYVYVQTTQNLKAIQAVARARSKKAKKKRYERERKAKYRAKKSTPKSKGKKK